jgi:hypothetical protein
MKFLQDRRVLWGGAVIIVLIVVLVLYAWPSLCVTPLCPTSLRAPTSAFRLVSSALPLGADVTGASDVQSTQSVWLR